MSGKVNASELILEPCHQLSGLEIAFWFMLFHGKEDKVTGSSSGVLCKDSNGLGKELDVLLVAWNNEGMIDLLVLCFDRSWIFGGIFGPFQDSIALDGHADREGKLIHRF